MFSFDTDLWWRTGELAEAEGSSLAGCTTNANTTEEPTSIIMTTSVKDMAQKSWGDWSCGFGLARGGWTLRYVHLRLTRQAVLLARAWEPGFLSSRTPQLGLEILNIVVLSPVNEHKEDDLAGEELRKRAEWKTRDAEPAMAHTWLNTGVVKLFRKFARNTDSTGLHWWSKASHVSQCAHRLTQTFILLLVKNNTASL